MNKKGFTLAELLIAMTVFAFVGILSTEVFLNVTKYSTRLALERKMYSDARYVMAKIVRELQKNTVDYEEYYNKLVIGPSLPDGIAEYSANYGKYAVQFYDLGSDLAKGAKCYNVIDGSTPDAPCDTNKGEFLNKNTVDTNTGTNPYGTDGTATSAVCNDNSVPPVSCAAASNVQTELYLIDSSGTKKTMLGRERIDDGTVLGNEQYALSILQMDGYDTTDDEVIDTWLCSEDFNCTGNNVRKPDNSVWVDGSGYPVGKYPAKKDLGNTKTSLLNAYYNFVPISPLESTITDLKFFIAPLEDPRKAFAEKSNSVQVQPYVTIVLTIQPAPSFRQGYLGEIPSVTFQSTVSTRIFNEVASF